MGPDCPATCPYVAGRAPELDFPVGQIHRLGAAKPGGGNGDVDETKRNVLKILAIAGVIGAAGGGLVGGSLQYAQPPVVGETSYQRTQLIDLNGAPLTATKVMSEFSVNTPDVITFNYPLRNEPNFLLNLAPPAGGAGGATNVPYGIGPSKSIVAYSAICQHLGCPAPAIAYYPPGTCPQTPGGKPFYIHCSCHGSTYDATNSASNLTGPAVLPLPQVILEWNETDDTIFATGMTPGSPPVNGHLDTLQGDYPVGSTIQLTKQNPVTTCFFPG
jgi:Rieske Fe-S protein